MIWKWLKAGYMEEGKYHEVDSGTPQGGVVSPLLANLYLNELDWKLEEHGIRFVRYADDFLLFAKTEEEIKKAAEITQAMLQELGLEVAMEKTKTVNFKDDDFDFLGFTFEHWRERKKDGKRYFIAKPKDSTWKDFKQKIKVKTKKTLTLNKKGMVGTSKPHRSGESKLLPKLVPCDGGKQEIRTRKPLLRKCLSKQPTRHRRYIRQRLRVAMIHKHPSQRKGHAMKTKWNNEFFARIGLVPAHWLYIHEQYGYSLEEYLDYMKRRQTVKQERKVQKAKECGEEYYTPDRVRKMQYSQRLATF